MDLTILGQLASEPMSAGVMQDRLSQWRLASWAGISLPGVHIRLFRLEEEGSVAVASRSAGVHGTLFSLTEPGRARLTQIIVDLIGASRLGDDLFRLAAFFIGLADPACVEPALQLRLAVLAREKREIERAERACIESGALAVMRIHYPALVLVNAEIEQSQGYLCALRSEPTRFRALHPFGERTGLLTIECLALETRAG